MSCVNLGSVLGPVLFTVYINDIDQGLFNLIKKFADDTKLIGKAKSEIDIDSIKSDLIKLEEWSDKWLMKFNAEKCKVMHIGWQNKCAKYIIGAKEIGRVTAKKDFGVIIDQF